jgi:RNA polymerase sigma-70 factor (ECF subfamily)
LADEELVARVQAGDQSAYAVLVERYSDYAFTIAIRIIGDEDDAADVAQEAFVRAYKAIGGFRGDSKFSSWLYRIVANRALTHLRRKKRRPWTVDIDLGAHIEADALTRNSRDDPGRRVLDEEFRRAMRGAVSRLPVQYRTVITLFYLEERSYKEVAETLGIPMGTLKTHLHRGRAMLRDILKEQEL